MAVQLVKAGEAVYSHRHTNAAMRFVIDGGEGVYTITNGEKCVMQRGDLVIQPSWGWHNHINETDRDAIWIDCLDSGLMRMLRTMFQEPHPAEDVRLFNSPVETTVRNPGLLAPPASAKIARLQMGETRRALAEMLPRAKAHTTANARVPQSGHGRPDLSDIFLLDSNARWRQTNGEHRHTSNQIYYAVEGSGVTEVEEKSSHGKPETFLSFPTGAGTSTRTHHEHTAVLFSTTDRPLHEAIGVYREQTR